MHASEASRRICIPSIFNEVRRENILFALPYPYSARPKGDLFLSAAAQDDEDQPQQPEMHRIKRIKSRPHLPPQLSVVKGERD